MKVLILIFLSLTTLAYATRISDTSSGYGGGKGGVSYGYGHEDGMHGGGLIEEGLGSLEGMMDGAGNVGKGMMGGLNGGISGIGHMGESALQRLAQQFGILIEDLRHFGHMGIYPLGNGACSCPAKLIGGYHGGHNGKHMHGGGEGYNNGMGGGFEGGNNGGYGGGNNGGYGGGNTGGYGVGNNGGYDINSNGGFDPILNARGSFGEEKGSENQPGTEHKHDLKDKPPTKQEH